MKLKLSSQYRMTAHQHTAAGSPLIADAANARPKWHNSYWLIAALPALLFFSSDSLEILMYDHARAPNAGVLGQIVLMLAFYAAWPLVPWLIWKTVSEHASGRQGSGFSHRSIVGKLVVLGISANLLHLTLLAVVLRILYSPPGWGFLHLVDSVVELWIQNAGVWYFVYLVFCLGIYYFLTKSRDNDDLPPPIYEVRSGNKILPINIADISWIEACGNYAQLHTDRGVFLVRKSLSTIERETTAHSVVRSHRGALVNTAFVDAVARDTADGQYRVELRSGGSAPLSRRRLATFKAALTPR